MVKNLVNLQQFFDYNFCLYFTTEESTVKRRFELTIILFSTFLTCAFINKFFLY